MRSGYAVVIEHMGEEILRIDAAMLSGKAELTDDDLAAIRDAGEHLMAFAGPERTEPDYSDPEGGSERG